MKASKKKICLAMARACVDARDLPALTGMPRPTINNVLAGRSVRPASLGKIARALGVDASEIVSEEK